MMINICILFKKKVIFKSDLSDPVQFILMEIADKFQKTSLHVFIIHPNILA